MAAPSCAFPLFRDRFWQREPLTDGNGPAEGAASAGGGPPACAAGGDGALSPTKAASRMGSLRMLDLRTLPRDDGPPTELRARREKLAHFERECTRVADGLYVGAEAVARSRDTLRAAGITHVVNCVGFLYPAYFEGELAYQTLFLQDTPGEDLLSVLYDVFDFIEAAASGGGSGAAPGRVLIHCSQGVSRSASLAIAYLMWKHAALYDDVFQEVKAARGVANPNIGFICQLLQWHKRRHAAAAWRLYRIAPQSHSAPQYLVPRLVGAPRQPGGAGTTAGLGAGLDPRGAFVLHGLASLSIWVGAACPEPFVAAAHRFAAQLHKYEAAPAPAAVVQQGQEPPAFWDSLARAAAGAGDAGGSHSGSPAAPGSAGAPGRSAAVAADLLGAAAGGQVVVVENSGYDKDFELYNRSLTARSSSHGADSARSGGRKTPREEGDTATSPNDRLRKQARGEERPPSPGKRRREPPSDLTLEDLQCVSMDSATAQLGKKERTLQEASSPPPLGRTISDMLPGTPRDLELADVASTPRSWGSEMHASGDAAASAQQQQQQQRLQSRDGRVRARQLSNLGRHASTASSAGAAASAADAPVPGAAAPGGRTGSGPRVPPLRLTLALPDRQ